MPDTSKYTAINELEAKAKWVRWYKFACFIFAVLELISSVIAILKVVEFNKEVVFWAGTAAVGVWSALIFGLQAKAIQNAEFDLQKKVTYFFYLNVLVLPLWSALGPITMGDLPNIIYGVGSFIVCLILLYLSVQIKNVFEGKKAFTFSKEDLGVTTAPPSV